jgi:hypothetical protein
MAAILHGPNHLGLPPNVLMFRNLNRFFEHPIKRPFLNQMAAG